MNKSLSRILFLSGFRPATEFLAGTTVACTLVVAITGSIFFPQTAQAAVAASQTPHIAHVSMGVNRRAIPYDLDYYHSYDLGPASGGRSPQSVLWWLTNRPTYEWPFEVHDLADPYSVYAPGVITDVGNIASSLQIGQIYALCSDGSCNPIVVTEAQMEAGDTAVLRFTALRGHVEGTGSTIRFSSWVTPNGELMFDVSGHDTFNYDGIWGATLWDPTAGWVAHGLDSLGKVKSLWDQLAKNVIG